MEIIKNIKWSYVIIAILVIIIIIVYFNKKLCLRKIQQEVESNEGYNSTNVQKPTTQPITQPTTDEIKGELILYYATWCGYSRMFLPEWDKFEKHARENLPQLRVIKQKCEGGDERTCTEKGIEGYPTVILYRNDGKEISFDKERTFDKLIEFVKSNL